MDPPPIKQLFEQTLEGVYDDDFPWEGVRTLHVLGTREIFDYAAKWCKSEDPLKRARGADTLSQLGKTAAHPFNAFPEEAYKVVSCMLAGETNVRSLASAIFALGHLGDPSALPIIAPYHAHLSPEVRYAVAFASGCFPDEPSAIQILLALMEDVDEDVRDWATFGVGVLGSTDTLQIRDALATRLADSDENTREEAVVALAKRKAHSVLPALTEMLLRLEPPDRAIEAASLMLDLIDEPTLTGHEYASILGERFQR